MEKIFYVLLIILVGGIIFFGFGERAEAQSCPDKISPTSTIPGLRVSLPVTLKWEEDTDPNCTGYAVWLRRAGATEWKDIQYTIPPYDPRLDGCDKTQIEVTDFITNPFDLMEGGTYEWVVASCTATCPGPSPLPVYPCTWARFQVATCGDGIKDLDEECDGLDFGTPGAITRCQQHCADQELEYVPPSEVGCFPPESVYRCTINYIPCVCMGVCGNGNCDPGECAACPGDCTVADCCGNGTRDEEVGEDCDGDDLGGETCESLGHTGGTLACFDPGTANECKFDETGCEAAPPPEEGKRTYTACDYGYTLSEGKCCVKEYPYYDSKNNKCCKTPEYTDCKDEGEEMKDPKTVSYDGLVPCGRELTVNGETREIPCQFCHFFVMLDAILDFVIEMAFIVAVLMLVFAGLILIVGRILPEGISPGTIQRAWSIMGSVATGLIIIFASWVIVNTIFIYVLRVEEANVGFTGPNKWSQIICPIELPQ